MRGAGEDEGHAAEHQERDRGGQRPAVGAAQEEQREAERAAGEREDFRPPRDGAMLAPGAERRAEAGVVEQPALQLFGGTRETGGGEDQERRRRQDREHDADSAQRDETDAAAEVDAAREFRSCDSAPLSHRRFTATSPSTARR